MKNVLLGGGLALSGILIGYAFGFGIDSTRKAGWWDIATAIGTVGSALGAVAIAVWSHVRRDPRLQTEGAFEMLGTASLVREATAELLFFLEQTVEGHIDEMRSLNATVRACKETVEAAQDVRVEMDPSDTTGTIRAAENHMAGANQRMDSLEADWQGAVTNPLRQIQAKLSSVSHLSISNFDVIPARCLVRAKAKLRMAETFTYNAHLAPHLRGALLDAHKLLLEFDGRIQSAETYIDGLGVSR